MPSNTREYRSAFLTGGAGFIGTHLTRALRRDGVAVTIYDSLHPQIHGDDPQVPHGEGIAFVEGDVRDGAGLREALAAANPDVVFHLAAETGTGQSHDLISRYCDVNVGGTARLIEALRSLPPSDKARRVVLASSRALYGEGAYVRLDGTPVVPGARAVADLDAGLFDPADADGMPLTLIPTTETTPPDPASIYASTKLMQEYVVRQGLAGSDIDAVVLRFQNVYGPGQTTRNPYTGVLSIFAAQAMAGRRLNIYEDGDIGRDFVFVTDVVDALCRAAAVAVAPEGAINIGSGERSTIVDAARQLLGALGKPTDALDISGDYRIGDIRNAVADIAQARALLGWEPTVPLAEGIAALVEWLPTAR